MKRLGSSICDIPTGRYLVEFPRTSTRILFYLACITILLAAVLSVLTRQWPGSLIATLLPVSLVLTAAASTDRCRNENHAVSHLCKIVLISELLLLGWILWRSSRGVVTDVS
jgi:hypothetical protein